MRADGVSPEELQRFVAAFDENVINRRSTTWRALSDEERKKDAVELLSRYPTLMKRPVIDDDGTLYLGWSKEVQEAVLSLAR